MRAHEFLDRASELVKGDRERQHGDKLENHDNIAAGWDAYIRRLVYRRYRLTLPLAPCVKAEDAANMMEILKVMRRLAGEFNQDDYTDGAGYAGVSGEIASRRKDCGA